jgi:C-terminal processing protease CtpA/Prc
MRWQARMWTPGMAALVLVLGMGTANAAATPSAAPEADAKDAWLGVYTQTLTPELREGLNYTGTGALVSRVVEDSPAAKAGVQKGDVIVGINTATIASSTDLTDAIGKLKVGQAISVRIVRDGTRRSLSAKLAERPAEEMEEAPVAPGTTRYKYDGDDFIFDHDMPGFAMFGGSRGRLGVRVQDLNTDLGSYFGISDGKGVLITEVLKETPAEKAGLKAGDVITKVGERRVDLVNALRDADQKVKLTVMRQKTSRTIESELRDSMVRRQSMSYHAPEIRIRREVPDDVRRELDDLRRELRDLKTKLEDKSHN